MEIGSGERRGLCRPCFRSVCDFSSISISLCEETSKDSSEALRSRDGDRVEVPLSIAEYTHRHAAWGARPGRAAGACWADPPCAGVQGTEGAGPVAMATGPRDSVGKEEIWCFRLMAYSYAFRIIRCSIYVGTVGYI